MGAKLKKSKLANPRDRRISLNQKAKLVTSDGNQMDVVVIDISAGGFRLEAEETLYDGENIVAGEAVVLRIERRYDLKAKIIWAKGCEAGGVFMEPLSFP